MACGFGLLLSLDLDEAEDLESLLRPIVVTQCPLPFLIDDGLEWFVTLPQVSQHIAAAAVRHLMQC
jgi:hypothetical protein